MSCLRVYAQTIPSTGEILQDDTTNVSIPISYIKLANQKLIERQYLIEINQYKDSIILDYEDYIKYQNKINSDYKKNLEEYYRINDDLNKRLEKRRKTNLVLGSITGASVFIVILMGIIN